MKLTKKVLFKQAKPVKFNRPFQNKQLADQMVEFMLSQNGMGLAAPQIGISKRIFVMQIRGKLRQCFNPEIVEKSSVLIEFNEGCLSFPGEQCIIKRPDTVIVRYQDAAGNFTETSLVGLEARCYQHEMDHLDGIIMHDRR